MATPVRTGNRKATEAVWKTKSDFVRYLFTGLANGLISGTASHAGTHECVQTGEGTLTEHGPTHTVAEVTRIVPNMGYAFAYGIAQRAGVNLTAANRKSTKKVTVADGIVKVKTSAGVVLVHPDGKVTRQK